MLAQVEPQVKSIEKQSAASTTQDLLIFISGLLLLFNEPQSQAALSGLVLWVVISTPHYL